MATRPVVRIEDGRHADRQEMHERTHQFRHTHRPRRIALLALAQHALATDADRPREADGALEVLDTCAKAAPGQRSKRREVAFDQIELIDQQHIVMFKWH